MLHKVIKPWHKHCLMTSCIIRTTSRRSWASPSSRISTCSLCPARRPWAWPSSRTPTWLLCPKTRRSFTATALFSPCLVWSFLDFCQEFPAAFPPPYSFQISQPFPSRSFWIFLGLAKLFLVRTSMSISKWSLEFVNLINCFNFAS